MLEASLVEEFAELGEELFDEFVGEDPNASFITRVTDDPVLGTVTEVATPVRAIKLDEEVPGGKGEKLFETAIYLLQSEVPTIAKDAQVLIGTRYHKIRAVTADPANVTWRAATDG